MGRSLAGFIAAIPGGAFKSKLPRSARRANYVSSMNSLAGVTPSTGTPFANGFGKRLYLEVDDVGFDPTEGCLAFSSYVPTPGAGRLSCADWAYEVHNVIQGPGPQGTVADCHAGTIATPAGSATPAGLYAPNLNIYPEFASYFTKTVADYTYIKNTYTPTGGSPTDLSEDEFANRHNLSLLYQRFADGVARGGDYVYTGPTEPAGTIRGISLSYPAGTLSLTGQAGVPASASGGLALYLLVYGSDFAPPTYQHLVDLTTFSLGWDGVAQVGTAGWAETTMFIDEPTMPSKWVLAIACSSLTLSASPASAPYSDSGGSGVIVNKFVSLGLSVDDTSSLTGKAIIRAGYDLSNYDYPACLPDYCVGYASLFDHCLRMQYLGSAHTRDDIGTVPDTISTTDCQVGVVPITAPLRFDFENVVPNVTVPNFGQLVNRQRIETGIHHYPAGGAVSSSPASPVNGTYFSATSSDTCTFTYTPAIRSGSSTDFLRGSGVVYAGPPSVYGSIPLKFRVTWQGYRLSVTSFAGGSASIAGTVAIYLLDFSAGTSTPPTVIFLSNVGAFSLSSGGGVTLGSGSFDGLVSSLPGGVFPSSWIVALGIHGFSESLTLPAPTGSFPNYYIDPADGIEKSETVTQASGSYVLNVTQATFGFQTHLTLMFDSLTYPDAVCVPVFANDLP